MTIRIKPSEIIERCIWLEYERFALRGKYNRAEIREIIKKDEEFEIDEHTAFVIGLLNRVYTPLLSYKLNQILKADLENKSAMVDTRMHINIDVLVDTAYKFKRNFPNEYKSKDKEFNDEYERLDNIIELFVYNINNLESILYKGVNMVRCRQVKKIINKVVV